MSDPRLTDVRAGMIHLEGVESALERARRGPVGPLDNDADVELAAAGLFASELRSALERAARAIDPTARQPLTRRADEPRIPTGS